MPMLSGLGFLEKSNFERASANPPAATASVLHGRKGQSCLAVAAGGLMLG
jgi:hypothetical protein